MSAAVAPLRHLGRLRLASIGLNSVIGGGIFILPATVAGLVGPASLFAFLVAAGTVVGIGLTLGRLAARFESSGGPYAYVERAFGPFAGFQVGWLFCLARLTAFANLLNGASLYLGALLPALARREAQVAIITGCAALLVVINASGIRQTSGVANVLAIVKIAPLLALGVAGIFLIEPARLVPSAVAPDAFLRSVLLLIFAFTGFEVLTVPAEESLRPRSDIPFALVLTIGVVCGLYILVHAAALGGLPVLASETAPLASLSGVLLGEGGRAGMTAVAVLSMIGCSLASLLGATRLLYAMSSAGQIPNVVGALDAKRRTPVVASVLTGGLGATLAIAGGYTFLAAVSSGTRLLIYLACCLACVAPDARGTWRGLRAAVAGRTRTLLIPGVTAAAIVLLLFRLERREVVFGMIGVGAGLGLYLLARAGRRGSTTRREVV